MSREQARRAMFAAIAIAAATASCEAVLDIPDAVDSGAGGAAASSPSSSSSSDASSTSTGGGGQASSTGGSGTSSPASSSSSSSSAGGCCDCDGDGHAAPGPCGGDDCDDGDRFAYPGETAYYTVANALNGFDWDCDGVPERDPKLDRRLDCTVAPPCDAAGEGYIATPPACGATGAWGSCLQQGPFCVASVIEQAKPMACR